MMDEELGIGDGELVQCEEIRVLLECICAIGKQARFFN